MILSPFNTKDKRNGEAEKAWGNGQDSMNVEIERVGVHIYPSYSVG